MINSPFTPSSRVAAYLRDSGHEDQELSVAQQEDAIRAWCAEHELILTRVFTDAAAPGSTTVGRSAFLEMIDHFRAPKCDERGVIVWKFNRFARDIDDAQFYKSDLRRRGYIIHSLHDAVPDGLDGRFFEAAIDWMNARYLDDLRADIIRGQRHILMQHGALGGTPPVGFRREPVQIGTRRDGRPHIIHRWSPDPEMVDRVRLAWSMRAEGRSYREIHRMTRLYRSLNSYHTFFKNPLYTGRLEFGDQVIDGYCEPVVDQETWEAVQNMSVDRNQMRGDNPNHPRRQNSSFLLSGLVYCAECHSLMNGELVAMKGHNYGYYRCSGPKQGRSCAAAKIPQRALEAAIIENLVKRVLRADNLRSIVHNYGRDMSQARGQAREQLTALNQTLTATRRQINNLSDVLAAEGLRSRSLIARVRELEAEEIRLIGEIERLSRIDQASGNPQLEGIIAAAERITAALLQSPDRARARTILRGLIDRIEVVREGRKLVRGVITYYLPPVEWGFERDFMSTELCPRRESNPQPRR